MWSRGCAALAPGYLISAPSALTCTYLRVFGATLTYLRAFGAYLNLFPPSALTWLSPRFSPLFRDFSGEVAIRCPSQRCSLEENSSTRAAQARVAVRESPEVFSGSSG